MVRYEPSPEEIEALEKTGWTHDADGWWRPPLGAGDFDTVYTFKEALVRQIQMAKRKDGFHAESKKEHR